MPASPEIQQRARAAKDRLRERFEREPWFRGVGIVPHGEGLGLRLNVSLGTDAAALLLPNQLAGLPVEVVLIEGYRGR